MPSRAGSEEREVRDGLVFKTSDFSFAGAFAFPFPFSFSSALFSSTATLSFGAGGAIVINIWVCIETRDSEML